jgi:hypothetical protein
MNLKLMDEEHGSRDVSPREYVVLLPILSRSYCLGSAEGLADAFFGAGWGCVTVEIGPGVVGT